MGPDKKSMQTASTAVAHPSTAKTTGAAATDGDIIDLTATGTLGEITVNPHATGTIVVRPPSLAAGV